MARAWVSRSGNQTTLALLHLPGLKRRSVREEAPTRAAGPEGGEASRHRAQGPTAVLQMGRPKHRHHSLGVPSVLESQTLRTGACPGSSQTAKGRGPWGGSHRWGQHTPSKGWTVPGWAGPAFRQDMPLPGNPAPPRHVPHPTDTAQPRLGAAKVRSCLRHAHVSERTTEAWDEGGAGWSHRPVEDWHSQAASSTLGISAGQRLGGGVKSPSLENYSSRHMLGPRKH